MQRISASLILAMTLLVPVSVRADVTTPKNFAPAAVHGRILLDVHRHGEAWYVNPTDKKRVFLANGTAAYSVLRFLGLGINNADLAKIPVGLAAEMMTSDLDSDGDGLPNQLETALGSDLYDTDSDDDGHSDWSEIANGYDPSGPGKPAFDAGFAAGLKGRILLQVDGHGEAWYLNPTDGKRYYMRNGTAAYGLMRHFGLGATSAYIDDIFRSVLMLDCGTDAACLAASIENDQISKAAVVEQALSRQFFVYWVPDTGFNSRKLQITSAAPGVVPGFDHTGVETVMVCHDADRTAAAASVRGLGVGTWSMARTADGLWRFGSVTGCTSYTLEQAESANLAIFP